jgi:hypothetical protein
MKIMASAEFRDCDPESIDRSRNAEPPDLSHEAALSFRKPDFRRTDELRTSPLFCHAQDAPFVRYRT